MRRSRAKLVNDDAFGSKCGGNAVDNNAGEQRSGACGSAGDSSACDIAG